MAILAVMFAKMSAIFIEERYMRDHEVQREQAKTALMPVRLDPSLKVDSFRASSTQGLNSVAGHLMFYEKVINVQKRCIEFLIQQHGKMTAIRRARMEQKLQRGSADLEIAAQLTRHPFRTESRLLT